MTEMALTEYRSWLMQLIDHLAQVDPLRYWRQVLRKPQADVVGDTYSTTGVEEERQVEHTEEVEFSEWDVYGEVCDLVREVGDVALRLGLAETYRATRVSSPITLANAREILADCLADCNRMIERATATASRTVGDPAATEQGGATIKSTPSERNTKEKKWRAISLLFCHPDWTKKRIAEHVGVDRRTLYNWKEFERAWRSSRAKDTGVATRGFKDKDGRLEAYSPATTCGCGSAATQDFNGEACCRECYLQKVEEDQKASEERVCRRRRRNADFT